MPAIDLMNRLRAFASRFKTQKPQVTMVVGMHRSGTSFLTGSLQQAGLELGKHSAWNPHNLKGNRENTDVVAINDTILASHGYGWDNPPPGTSAIAWSDEHIALARALIEGYTGCKHWGFKDPRSILVLDGWRALIPQLQFVGIFRHPNAVAKSLDARGGMPTGQAWALWKNYNERLLALHAEKSFPVLCFDEPEEILLGKLDSIITELDLTPRSSALQQDVFFSAELKHQDGEGQRLPEDLQAIYQRLKDIAR